MDLQDLFYVGSNILDEVNEAVRTGDYSHLGSSLREMNEKMQQGAERARQEQEKLRRIYQQQMQNKQADYARYRQGGQPASQGRGTAQTRPQAVPRSTGNAAQQMPVLTPFMQKRISRLSGLGRIVGGTAVLVVAALLLTLFLVLGIALSGGWMIGAGICAAIAIAMIWQIAKGVKRRNLVNLFFKFGSVLGRREYFKVEDLAKQTGRSPDQVRDDIKAMIKDDLLPYAKFDAAEDTVMLTQKMYQNYLDAEKGRLEREAMERREQEAQKKAGMTDEVSAILREGESYLAMVRQANDEIPGDEMSDKLLKLESIMDRIFTQVRKDPKSAQNLRKFMNYYLPTTQKLLSAYVELDKQKEDVANVTNTKREVESAMDTINEAFENLLDSLFEEVAWDVSSDISAMRAMMAQDGLTPDDIAAAGQKTGAFTAPAPEAEEMPEKETAVQTGGVTLTFGGGAAQAQAAQEEKH